MYLLLKHTNEGKIDFFCYNSFIAAYTAKTQWEEEGYYVEFFIRAELRL